MGGTLYVDSEGVGTVGGAGDKRNGKRNKGMPGLYPPAAKTWGALCFG